MPADPYTTLGVSKNASAEEIKKAYRALAHKHHPDKKGGDEAKFKEINEAYQTLSDPDKKTRYDQFGHAGASGGFGGGQYQDFNFDFGGGFESIFDMFGGGASRTAQRPSKGEDLHLQVSVSKKDLGQRKVYEFEAFSSCDTCHASGVAPGAKRVECKECKGAGQVRRAVQTPFGTFAQVVTCPKCQGDGEIPEKLCEACNGSGRTKARRTLEVHLPKAIDDGYLIAFPTQGNAGPLGTPAGDLLVTLRTK